MFAADDVPQRSPLGDACVNVGDARVNGRQRQLLRLIDGVRTVAQIAAMMPGRDVAGELLQLQGCGQIMGQTAPVSAAAALTEALPERWVDAMAFMKQKATESLGVMAHATIQLLERVKDSAAAKSAVARWHMALRESRNGRAQADAHLQWVTEMLGL